MVDAVLVYSGHVKILASTVRPWKFLLKEDATSADLMLVLDNPLIWNELPAVCGGQM